MRKESSHSGVKSASAHSKTKKEEKAWRWNAQCIKDVRHIEIWRFLRSGLSKLMPLRRSLSHQYSLVNESISTSARFTCDVILTYSDRRLRFCFLGRNRNIKTVQAANSYGPQSFPIPVHSPSVVQISFQRAKGQTLRKIFSWRTYLHGGWT